MGILNVTPDSFSDGGRFTSTGGAVAAALEMIRLGADIIDVGGESTRPDAAPVSVDEEISRTAPVVRALRALSPAVISIDTTKAAVAEAAMEAGADIINDVSAMRFDPAMASLAAQAEAGVILMHTPGRPDEMGARAVYEDVVEEVRAHLLERAHAVECAGVPRESIALDPGFGFGKTPAHNYELLMGVDRIVALGFPVLVGVSRKRHIRAAVGMEALAVEHGTTTANTAALLRGCHMVRVHDVEAGVACVKMAAALMGR
ncbi:MAG: dihydropteroate synthase [Bradymonadia bacterium]|jgi:dihydropteroate synthase